MARNSDLKSLVDRFAADLERAVSSRVNSEFASRFDELRRDILSGATRAPAARGGGARRRTGPRPGYVAQEKPCPVCGTMNKARRFSYLCEQHRTAENLKKFKGAAKEGAAEPAAKRGGAAKGKGKRGPGRPRKTAKTETEKQA